MTTTDGRVHIQFGALPFSMDTAGNPRLMLVTSRGSRDWIIPKGWPIRNLTPAATAAREAYEEAGLLGAIVDDRPIGAYRYTKRGGAGRAAALEVSVFLLAVERQLAKWPEKAERKTRWFDPAEASARVASSELAALMRAAAPDLAHFARRMPRLLVAA